MLEDRIYLIHFASLQSSLEPRKKKKKEATQLREGGRKAKKERERDFKGERGLIVSKCLDAGYDSQKKIHLEYSKIY